jgi:hypothetical protein
MKCFTSLHFSLLILESWYDSLDGESVHHKAATYTGEHKHRINANIHALSGIRINGLSVRAGEDISDLKPHDHCDQHPSNLS